ncbi:MAG: mechanosensitive ion channel family protein [Endomicrobium sp.]|jgi:small-conductance mechanosensitive channel|nr:mechanosensitive ion channel family protein [Endomicrobium sp.]
MFDFFNRQYSDFTLWIISAVVLLAVFFIGFLLRKYAAVFIRRLLEKIGIITSDETSDFLKKYISFWSFLVGLYCAFFISPLNHKDPVVLKIFYTIFAFSIVFLLGNIFAGVFRKTFLETISINIIKFVVIAVGGLLILNQIGIKLTPMLTALGIGSLAVALALQDTLGNFFAGINILFGKQIARGDYIKLDSGQEGTVIEIGWRATKIRETSNVLIIIPNLKVASAIISKYNFSRAEVTTSIDCGIAYGSDLEKAEKIAVEAAREILNFSEGAVKSYTPICRFNKFADSSINFTLTFRVKEVFVKSEITHAVLKNLKKRFDEEGIEIPFPERVVRIRKNVEKD